MELSLRLSQLAGGLEESLTFREQNLATARHSWRRNSGRREGLLMLRSTCSRTGLRSSSTRPSSVSTGSEPRLRVAMDDEDPEFQSGVASAAYDAQWLAVSPGHQRLSCFLQTSLKPSRLLGPR